MRLMIVLAVGATALVGAVSVRGTASATRVVSKDAPTYTADGRLMLPVDYREWVFLSSGIDMSYTERPVHQFDNVFAPRDAYRAFLRTGVWPDKTVLILENRGAQTKGSITRSGQFQNGNVIGLEAHVKDKARFDGGWAFFGARGDVFPRTANCYACHKQHAAAATTFVQFYPTLLPTATRLKTLSPTYLAERSTEEARR